MRHSVIEEWVRSKEMLFGCLPGDKTKKGKADRIIKYVLRGWSSMTNYEHSAGGRIWLVWRDSDRLTPVYKSDQLITCLVSLKDTDDEFFCTFVYVKNTAEERKELRDDLCYHHNSPLFQGKAWMIMGDFNEILDGEEHSGYDQSSTVSLGMRDFERIAHHCLLTDLGSQGPRFTWCNKQVKGLVCKKLDRVLFNDVALHRFTQAYSVFEPGGCSDHLRCSIQIVPENIKIRRPFMFVNATAKLPTFLSMVEEFWASTEKLFVSTSSMFRFSKKLKALKPLIRNLGREQQGDFTKRSNHTILCEKQKKNLLAPTA